MCQGQSNHEGEEILRFSSLTHQTNHSVLRQISQSHTKTLKRIYIMYEFTECITEKASSIVSVTIFS